MGIFALAGGDEFRRSYEPSDRAILELLPVNAGPLIILPTAAAQQGPEMAIANGVRYFSALAPRLSVEGAMVVDSASAADAAVAARIASASMIYLTGGDPGLLVRLLRGSEVLAAIAAVAARGGIVVGSSAGAMALGSLMRWHTGSSGANGWEPAFAMVPGVIVMPHHEDRPKPLAEVRAGLDDTLVVIGIPTGVMCLTRIAGDERSGDHSWQVLGNRPITLYRASGVTQIPGGGHFLL